MLLTDDARTHLEVLLLC